MGLPDRIDLGPSLLFPLALPLGPALCIPFGWPGIAPDPFCIDAGGALMCKRSPAPSRPLGIEGLEDRLALSSLRFLPLLNEGLPTPIAALATFRLQASEVGSTAPPGEQKEAREGPGLGRLLDAVRPHKDIAKGEIDTSKGALTASLTVPLIDLNLAVPLSPATNHP